MFGTEITAVVTCCDGTGRVSIVWYDNVLFLAIERFWYSRNRPAVWRNLCLSPSNERRTSCALDQLVVRRTVTFVHRKKILLSNPVNTFLAVHTCFRMHEPSIIQAPKSTAVARLLYILNAHFICNWIASVVLFYTCLTLKWETSC
jgi:hypothetical protein